MPWYISYREADGFLLREGEQPEPQPEEKGYVGALIDPTPIVWDAVTGKRLLAWNPVARRYEAAE